MSLPRAPGWFERSKSSTVDTFESKWAIDDDNCLFLVFGRLFDTCLYLIVVENAVEPLVKFSRENRRGATVGEAIFKEREGQKWWKRKPNNYQ